MSQRKFKNWLSAYLQYSSHSEAPERFHFWTGVSTLAGALRRRVYIDMGYFQWTPNFYIIFVAPPGIVSKSTTASIGMRLLRELPDVHFGPDAVTWQSLVESLSGALDNPMDPATGELIPMSCITISSSEFGTFLNPSDREMVDVLVSLWDGQVGTFEKRTKTQGSDIIINPWMNINACTTPSWIAGNFPDYMIGGGFTSRCIFVYGEQKRKLVAYPSEHIPADFKRQASDLVHDLEIISQLIGEYSLSPQAKAWGEQWYETHYSETSEMSELDTGRWGGYRARKQTHIHKLAMILAAAKRDELVIEAADLQEAERLVTGIEREMPKVFSLIGRSEDARHAEIVVATVQRYKAIDKSVLVRELFRTLSLREIEEGIQAALAGGLISSKQLQGRIILYDEFQLRATSHIEDTPAVAEGP